VTPFLAFSAFRLRALGQAFSEEPLVEAAEAFAETFLFGLPLTAEHPQLEISEPSPGRLRLIG
jgi:hypothetical protein